MAQNLYTSFKRLQNLPLDLSTVYETYSEAKQYVERYKTKAHPGQVIAVYNDDDTEKNGIYVILTTSDSSILSGLTFKKSADADDLKKLKDEIDNDIKEKLKELDVKFSDIQKEIEGIKNELSDEFFEKINATQKDVEDLKSDLSTTRTDLKAEIAAAKDDLQKKIDKLYDDEGLDDTLNSIIEIAKWIEENGNNMLGTIATIQSRISKIENNLDLIKAKNDEQDITISDINKDIKTLNDDINVINTEINTINNNIIDLRENADKHYSFNMDIPGTKSILVADMVIDSVDISVDTPYADATFNCIVADKENEVLLISSEDTTDDFTENQYSLIDISTKGRYSYNLNYPIVGEKYIRFTTTAGGLTQNLSLNVRLSVSKSKAYNS